MNRQLILLTAAASLSLPAHSQAPSSFKPLPFTAFETRNNGKTLEHEPNIQQPGKTTKRVTFTAVTDMRDWKGANGNTIQARLLAFERAKPADDTPLTLIRDRQVRLLVSGAKRFSEIPLDKLSSEDQQFILGLNRSQRVPVTPTSGSVNE